MVPIKEQPPPDSVIFPLKVPVRLPPVEAELKIAVTVMLAFIVRVQVPVPAHAPDHPAKVEPVLGVAVNVTAVPGAKLRQPGPHAVPAGEELTVPLPVVVMVSAALTVRDTCGHGMDDVPLRSTAQTRKRLVPTAVGVPVNKPLRFKDRPKGGKPPAVSSWK
jgi:hypothetical protein